MSFADQFSMNPQPWEKKENPQAYDRFISMEAHPRPTQHMLGVVGGNEVAIPTWDKMRDIESDLRGITRANTFCPKRQHSPLSPTAQTVKRNTPKQSVVIQTAPKTMPQSQMWAYPATLAPEPFVHETCGAPWKY